MKIDKVTHHNMSLQADDTSWAVTQDIQPFLDQAAAERKFAAEVSNPNKSYRKFGTIPDIVCIEIKNRFNVDIHDPATANDPNEMARFKMIIKRDYPYLLSN